MSDNNESLLVQKSGYVCTLVLNRPEKRNSLSPELLVRLRDTLSSLAETDDTRTVVIRGSGDKAFCAGYDIGALVFDDDDPNDGNGRMTERENPFERAMAAIINFPYPVMAMLNGYAFGGGCDLAAACDIRIGSEKTRMGMVPAKLGVVYSLDGLRRFVRVVGQSNARDLFFTGDTFDAAKLKAIGMLNYVVPAPELESFTTHLAETIAANAPLSLKGIKRSLNLLAAAGPCGEEAYRENGRLVRDAFLSRDFKEGQASFFEKRPPRFNGN